MPNLRNGKKLQREVINLDKNRINRIRRKFDKTNNPPPPPPEVAFNCQLNIDDLNPLYPHKSNRMYLRGHISDNAMRSILHLALVDLGMENCTNEELCAFMVQEQIWTETDASIWTLNYLANKQNKSIDDYCI